MTLKTEVLGIGDVVRLNSSKVRMTVRRIEGDCEIRCRWHDADDDLLEEVFDHRELTLVCRADPEA